MIRTGSTIQHRSTHKVRKMRALRSDATRTADAKARAKARRTAREALPRGRRQVSEYDPTLPPGYGGSRSAS